MTPSTTTLSYKKACICWDIMWQLQCLIKGKAIPLQAWTGSEGSKRLRLPNFKTFGTWRWYGCHPYAPAVFSTVVKETHCTKVLLLLLLIVLIILILTTTAAAGIHNKCICTVARYREFCLGFCWFDCPQTIL